MRRSKADAEQTRTAILDAAEMVFHERGVAQATLEQIARAAGVTRGAFYWHFKHKADVLRSLRERCKPPQVTLMETAARMGHEDPLALLLSSGIEILSLFEKEESRQRMFIILSCLAIEETAESDISHNEEMFCLLHQLMMRAREADLLADDISTEEAAGLLMIVMNGLLSEWLRSKKAFSLTDFGTRFLTRQITALRKTAP